jgi:hypothetical protein
MLSISGNLAIVRRLLLVAVALVLVGALAACGGDSAGGEAGEDFPVPDGAEELDTFGSVDDDLGFDINNGGGAVYTSTESVLDVAGYYKTDATADGWEVSTDLVLEDGGIVVVNKEKQVVIVNLQTGASIKAEPGIIEDDAIDVDLDDIGDEETVMVLAYFECDEDDVQTCLSFGQ